MKYFILSCLVAAFSNLHGVNSLQPEPSVYAAKDTIPTHKEATKNETLSGKWILQPVLASDTAAGSTPTLTFDPGTNKVTGNTGCNTFSAGFISKGSALSFGQDFMASKMACPGYNEKAFLDNLLKTNRYEIKNGILQLMYNTTVLSNWARHADTSTTKQL